MVGFISLTFLRFSSTLMCIEHYFYSIGSLIIIIYIYIYIFFFLLGGLPLYGVYDSFVDYPYDDVAYCH